MISNYTIKEPTVEGIVYDGNNLDEIERWLFFKNAFFTLSERVIDEEGTPSSDLILRTVKKTNGFFTYYIVREGDLVVLDKYMVCKEEKSQVFVVKEEDIATRFEFKDFADNHLSPSPTPQTTPPWDAVRSRVNVKNNGYESQLAREVGEEIWPDGVCIEPIEKNKREINREVHNDYARVTLSTRRKQKKDRGYERLLQTNRKPIVSTMGVKSFNL